MVLASRFLVAIALLACSTQAEARARLRNTVPGHTGHAVSSPAEPPPAIPPGELDDAVAPAAYRLDLTVDPAQERFSGRTEIDVVLKQPSRHIVLHGNELAVRKAEARVGGRSFWGEWRQVDPTGIALLTFAEPLPAGPVTLAFEHDAAFNQGPSGMFRVKVGSDWYSWTQFQSIDARAAFPSFDQPSFKTPFTVTLRTPPGLVAVSNAPQVSLDREGGLDVHRYAPTLPLPTYLVAMMVGPFAMAQGEVAPTPQRPHPLPLRIVSTRPNAGKLDFALQGSREIVALLEDYFGDAFPYPKLDQITSPIMPGAMENAGADLYDDAIIVMDRNAPVPQQRRFGMVVAHELAHQWFGDLVTPRWWDDIWLNESFANWMGYRIGDAWKPGLNIRSGALAEGFAAMETDSLTAGRPIRQQIATNGQIDGTFDSITYGKGGHVVGMIAAWMGDDRFRDGVRRYMATHRNSNATSADFFAALADAAHDPRIVPAMQSFIDQQGVPVLTFRRVADRYTVSQSRYAPLGSAPPTANWGIPYCVRRDAARICRLLADKRETIDIPDGKGALVPNAGGAGYYRFDLSDYDWNLLIESARELSGGEAQATADSLHARILAGRGDIEPLARLARILVSHPDSYASDAASDALAGLVGSGLIDTRGRWGWRKFRGNIYAPLLSAYGFDPRAGAYAGENPEKTQRRVQIVQRLVGTARGGKLRAALVAAADRYLAGDAAALDPAWFEPAFETFVFKGGEMAARGLLDKALSSEDPVFRPAALNAVASSGSNAVARWLLNDLKDERLRASEKRDLLSGIMFTRDTRDTGYDWIVKNIDELVGGRGGIFFSSKLPRLFSRYCSVEQAGEIAAAFRKRLAGTPGQLELDRVVEKVRNCGVLSEVKGEQLSAEFAKLR